MSSPNTLARLAFHGFGEAETPAPSPERARVDAACSSRATARPAPPLRGGPEREHRIHWRYVISAGRLEVRLTTFGGKVHLRPWFRTATTSEVGGWFPTAATRLVSIDDREIGAFARAVAEAAAALAGEAEKP